MDALSYKTVFAKNENVQKGWILVDAENQTVGRLASMIAYVLRGKNKATFTPNIDTGDNVIVINAGKVKFTGKKLVEKEYIRHTGYPGGQRFATPKELLNRKPTAILENAVHGMLPKSRMGDKLKRNLFIYAGAEHPHTAQQPKEIKISTLK